MTNTKIEFIDLKAQRRRLGARLDAAIGRVVDHGGYILGPEVAQLEQALADYAGARHAIGCANGTDAIALCLMAMNVRPGDAIIVPSFTFASTAEVVAWLGAKPVFAEVDERTFNLDPECFDNAYAAAIEAGLKPRGLIAVDLFGQPADYDRIEAYCASKDLFLIVDSAQAFGSVYKGRRSGTIGLFTTTSFFPAKPLGCYGDGGAIFTANDELAEVLRSLHIHGKGSDKYDNIRVGMNSRLDTLQAAILMEKLAIYDDEIAKRQDVARRYDEALKDVAITPLVMKDCLSVWAQYTLRVPAERRATFCNVLKEAGVPTAIYYPKSLHQQTAYRRYPVARGGLAVSERISAEVVSLPMHPYLDSSVQARIIDAARAALVPSAVPGE
ncbi:MAG: DegT/DnrJ/EryC1/StrS family aminotransferase [Xanthobacteraceae bacterium]